MLNALGGLELSGSDYATPLPLLVLLYQRLQGTTSRSELARTFWPRGADPLNSLSGKLKHLRKNGLAETFEETATDVRTIPVTDVEAFRVAVAGGDFETAARLFRGPFLGTVRFTSLSPVVVEWIDETRRELDDLHLEATLGLAEARAARGEFRAAAEMVAEHFRDDSEPEALRRQFLLLRAADHPLALKAREEAEYTDLYFRHTPEEARRELRTSFIGRERELVALRRLPAGRTAWIEAAQGMGKTTLLGRLEGSYLPARSGLPFGTLAPLFGGAPPLSETEALQHLRSFSGNLLVDDWTAADPESRAALERLSRLQPGGRLFIAGTAPPAFEVNLHLTLAPLTQDDLASLDGAWVATGGLPYLVDAFVRDESLEPLLGPRLYALEGAQRDVYVALGMIGEPDPVLVRNALELSATEFASIFGRLVDEGFVTRDGAVRASPTVRRYLATQHLVREELAIRLARQLEGSEAFRFFDLARLLWEESDLPAARDAYLARANDLLETGALRLAYETLERAPQHPAVTLLRARVLTSAGRYSDALRELEPLGATPEVLAHLGALHWRLGHEAEAEEASTRALGGEASARAEAFNTLGHIARERGEYAQAISYARKAGALWNALGNDEDRGGALNNLAVAKMLAGEDTETAFADALRATDGNAAMRAHVLISKGYAYERQGRLDDALENYEAAAEMATEAGALSQAAIARNNIGVAHHKHRRVSAASTAYREAIRLANEGNQPRTRYMAMANLAELDDDPDAWEEALRELERAGYVAMVEEYRSESPFPEPPDAGIDPEVVPEVEADD